MRKIAKIALRLSLAFFLLSLFFFFAVVSDLGRGDMRELAAEVVLIVFAIPSLGLALLFLGLAKLFKKSTETVDNSPPQAQRAQTE